MICHEIFILCDIGMDGTFFLVDGRGLAFSLMMDDLLTVASLLGSFVN